MASAKIILPLINIWLKYDTKYVNTTRPTTENIKYKSAAMSRRRMLFEMQKKYITIKRRRLSTHGSAAVLLAPVRWLYWLPFVVVILRVVRRNRLRVTTGPRVQSLTMTFFFLFFFPRVPSVTAAPDWLVPPVSTTGPLVPSVISTTVSLVPRVTSGVFSLLSPKMSNMS